MLVTELKLLELLSTGFPMRPMLPRVPTGFPLLQSLGLLGLCWRLSHTSHPQNICSSSGLLSLRIIKLKQLLKITVTPIRLSVAGKENSIQTYLGKKQNKIKQKQKRNLWVTGIWKPRCVSSFSYDAMQLFQQNCQGRLLSNSDFVSAVFDSLPSFHKNPGIPLALRPRRRVSLPVNSGHTLEL